MTARRLLLAAALSLLALPLAAQTVTTDEGTTEFVGLRRWTPAQIVDTLRALAPGAPLHACAVALNQQLGFPDAAVVWHPGATPDAPYIVVTVVEPGDERRVRFRPAPTGTVRLGPAWRALAALPAADGDAFLRAVKLYGDVRDGHSEAARTALQPFIEDGVDSTAVEAVWAALARRTAPADVRLARDVLLRDARPAARMAAVGVLRNAPESEATWLALVGALRDADGMVRSSAQTALYAMARATPPRVDWAPAAADLRLLLNGTNLFSFTVVADLLVRTGVDPRLAGRLVGGNADLLVAYTQAENPAVRAEATRLLVHLAGRDLGSAGAWSLWARRLPRSA